MATQEITLKITANAAQAAAAMRELASSTTASVSQAQASVLAGQRVFSTSLKALETQMASLKARIKEVRAETDIGFKTQRLDALKDQLKQVTTHHRDLTKATKDSAQAMEQDLSGALSAVSPRLAALASAAGPFTLIAAAAVAAAAGVGLFSKALFDVAVSTAAFQGKLFDLSQQTGVSVETLSALDVMAAQTGSDIGAVTASLGIFQKNLEAARDPASELAKVFNTLGVETDNTEEALRESLKALAKMPEGYHQTAVALQIFGRGGKAFLAILKEMHGDLDGTIERLDAMGILIKTNVSKEADKFNDQMVVLDRQMKALGATIGVEVMPAVLAAINSLSTALKENAETLHAVGVAAGFAAAWLSGQFTAAIRITEAAIWASMPGFRAIAAVLEKIHDLTSTLGPVAGGATGGIDATGGIGSAASLGGDASLGRGILRRRGTGGGGGRAARDTALQDATREAALTERESLLITTADITENKRAFEEGARNIEEFTRRAIELNEDQLNATIDRITAESDALDVALAKKLIKQRDYEIKQRELDLDAAKAHQDNKDNQFKLEQDRDRDIAEARIAAKKRELQILEEADQRDIKSIERRIDEGVILESAGQKQIGAIIDAALERRRAALVEEEDAYSTTLERRKDVNAEIIRLDNERAASAEETARRVAKAQFDEQNAGAQGATRNRRFAIDRPEITGSVDQLFEAIHKELTGATQSAALAALEAMSLGFEQLGNAIGQALHAFVLFGSAGTSVRKVTAEVLAGIAQMAATKAIFHLAEGFAALAMAFFGVPNAGPSAAAHFKAAAIYGLVAGVAAVAGRGVAGNAFNNATGGGGGGGGNGPGQLNPLTLPRNQPQPIRIVIGVDDSTFGRAITAHVVKDVQEAGQIREVIANDGAFT